MTLTLYTGLGSGNGYKVELMLRLLDLPYQARSVSIPRNEQRDPVFRRLNPFAQIPVLVDGTATYSDSQAILAYLARAYGGTEADRWLPIEPGGLATVMRWLSVAGNEIQNSLTMARAIQLLKWSLPYDIMVDRSYKLLRLMDEHLGEHEWLALGHATIADIACYPYLLLAAEGGIDTRPYAAVAAWLRRVESLPRFWPMPRIPNLPPVALVPPPAG
jgi:glutathione S-transferase